MGQQMRPKKISLCEDETFHPEVCLVAMEPVSNFIVVEQYAPNRTGETWNQLVEGALQGWPVSVLQSTSDRV